MRRQNGRAASSWADRRESREMFRTAEIKPSSCHRKQHLAIGIHLVPIHDERQAIPLYGAFGQDRNSYVCVLLWPFRDSRRISGRFFVASTCVPINIQTVGGDESDGIAVATLQRTNLHSGSPPNRKGQKPGRTAMTKSEGVAI